jgi:hypothetical protein
MGALKVILSKIFSVLLHALLACVSLCAAHTELFYPTPYLASTKDIFCSYGRTQGFMAILSISSYFNAALCIPAMCKLQTIQAELSNDK